MELPIAQESYQPSREALVRAVKRARIILARTAAEENTLDRATLLVNAGRPSIAAINLAAELHLGEDGDPERLLDEIDAHFQALGGRCLRLESSDLGFPATLEAAARARGYAPRESILFLLQGYTSAERSPAPIQIIPARAAYGQLSELFRAGALEEPGGVDAVTAEHWARTRIDFLDEARLDVFLGRLNSRAGGFISLLSLGQIGLIEHVFTLPELRGQGVATRLIDHVIEICERAQFEQVIVTIDAHSAARPLFVRVGFQEVARYTTCVRQ